MSLGAEPPDGWVLVGARTVTIARVAAFVIFLIMALAAFLIFYATLDVFLGLPEDIARVGYLVLAGIVSPLAVLLSGIATISLWAQMRGDALNATGARRIRWIGFACVVLAAVGLIGTAIMSPAPFDTYGRGAIAALALTLVVGVVLVGGLALLLRRRRPLGSAA